MGEFRVRDDWMAFCLPDISEAEVQAVSDTIRSGWWAKGRLLGVQFDALMEDDLYFKISAHADAMADKIRAAMEELNIPSLVPGITNQIFPILPDDVLNELAKTICFTEMERVDDIHRCIRFCTSWATTEKNVQILIDELRRLCR